MTETPASAPSRWKYRLLYVSVMIAFAAALVWTGSGPAANPSAFQKLVVSSLKRLEPGLRFEHLAEGVVLATGQGTFEFLDLRADWERFRREGQTSEKPILQALVARLKAARDEAQALADDPDPAGRLAAMPVPLAHFHAEMTPELATRHLTLEKMGELGAFLFYRNSAGAWRLFPRFLPEGPGAAGQMSKDQLFAAALANAQAAEWFADEKGALKVAEDALPPLALLLAPGFEQETRERLKAQNVQFVATSLQDVRAVVDGAQVVAEKGSRWPKAIVFVFGEKGLTLASRGQ